MLCIERRLICYRSIESNREMNHHILIANIDKKHVLLSHPNLFLSENARSSKCTSNRYSGVISMFYRFLSTQKKYESIDVSLYHVLSDNRDIKRWQVERQIMRVREQKDSPSSSTIFEDAKILLMFFKWVKDAGYITNVNIQLVNWVANFKNSNMLNYVRKKAKIKIDAKNITVLDKERRQKKVKTLITNMEIKTLIESYSDPVYGAMFKLSLGTAMRPMDLCGFPYLGNGSNKHILPYSDMSKGASAIVEYTVRASKGNKSRTIKINRADLKVLEKYYIKPYYSERADKYEEKYGKKCPPSILFLNKKGEPVTPSKVASRTNDAKVIAKNSYADFRDGVVFYDARHWWPTMFLVNFFKDRLLTESADVLYAAAAQVLIEQMGHEDIGTTYKYYVDLSRLVVMAHKGKVSELITEEESVGEFIERMDGVLVA
ncbi:DNA breaking-rejoining enzyme [Colwellia psychrerythraea]|uniref:DNA breaking-rejoining enzyme n=1 Tax=Colwellia psychrerythraea TaxID=28229 RepID=A0A1Y5EUN4_COLPS|nr:DNA breaking-rejoining enzyme [Colwellia psychrerythraea]